MSGGHFDYMQHRIEEIADRIDKLITEDGHSFREDTLDKFREAVLTLHRAYAMVHRIDWLVSGDDSEDTFTDLWGE